MSWNNDLRGNLSFCESIFEHLSYLNIAQSSCHDDPYDLITHGCFTSLQNLCVSLNDLSIFEDTVLQKLRNLNVHWKATSCGESLLIFFADLIKQDKFPSLETFGVECTFDDQESIRDWFTNTTKFIPASSGKTLIYFVDRMISNVHLMQERESSQLLEYRDKYGDEEAERKVMYNLSKELVLDVTQGIENPLTNSQQKQLIDATFEYATLMFTNISKNKTCTRARLERALHEFLKRDIAILPSDPLV